MTEPNSSQSDSDRRVHAQDGIHQVVRYDRAGKWKLESRSGEDEPANLDIATAAHIGRQMLRAGGGEVFFGVPGGKRFDALVRRAS